GRTRTHTDAHRRTQTHTDAHGPPHVDVARSLDVAWSPDRATLPTEGLPPPRYTPSRPERLSAVPHAAHHEGHLARYLLAAGVVGGGLLGRAVGLLRVAIGNGNAVRRVRDDGAVLGGVIAHHHGEKGGAAERGVIEAL